MNLDEVLASHLVPQLTSRPSLLSLRRLEKSLSTNYYPPHPTLLARPPLLGINRMVKKENTTGYLNDSYWES